MMQIHDFLDNFDDFRAHCDGLDYEGVTNPHDGVFYPGVSLDVPEDVAEQVKTKIEAVEDRDITLNALFLRISTEGMEAPHQAHTDTIMGSRSFMLYMNRKEHCKGGTALVRHVSGMDSDPIDQEGIDLWAQDTNNPDKWEITCLCDMEPNKACLFDARLMHRAEPVGGFGYNGTNGRLVLTGFYD